jgi:TPR repeat protein
MTRDFRRSCLVLLLVIAVSHLELHAQDSTSVGKLPIAKLQQLADSGDPAAQNELGIRYRVGTDVEKDPAKAIPWFLKAAKQGYAKAYFNLGAAYYNGDGVPVNDQNYCAWFIFSADAGDQRGVEAVARTRQELPPAQMNRCEVLVATAYLTGGIVRQDYGKALNWYVTAATAGDGAACAKLAYLYDNGIGVSVDKAGSLRWLQRAADLNDPPSLYQLGMAYETGTGVPTDFAKAKKLYEQASYLGLAQAFAALGAIYAEGRGVKPDQQKALAYYLVAANNKVTAAQQKVDDLSAKLSAKQVAAAKQDAAKLSGFTRGPVILVRK